MALLPLASVATAVAAPPPPVMPHLVWPLPSAYPCAPPPPHSPALAELTAALDCRPTYNLSRATVIQTCQKPGTSLDYIRDYGIVSYDWSNNAATWVRPTRRWHAAGLRLA